MTGQHIDSVIPLNRLNMMLMASGLVESQAKAQRLIRAGHVRVNGETITRLSLMVEAGHSELAMDKGNDYVPRGVCRLLGALGTFTGDDLTGPKGLECLGIGASTGGFTDVLLRGGAVRTVAPDTGYGQLDSHIANDEHVVGMGSINIRETEADDLSYRSATIISNISFISLTYVIPVTVYITAPGAQIALLVKP